MAGQAGHENDVHRARSPWENGYCESFNGKLRDECLNGKIFYFAEGGTDSDGEVARGIQHGEAALGAGLQATSAANNLAEATGAWRYGKRCAFPTSPHPRTTTTDKCPTRRYTNTPLGTNDLSGHPSLRTRSGFEEVSFISVQRLAATGYCKVFGA